MLKAPFVWRGFFYIHYLCLKQRAMGITIPGTSPTSATGYIHWKSGSSQYREGVRSGILYTDKLKDGGSWSEAEGVGWDVVRSVQ